MDGTSIENPEVSLLASLAARLEEGGNSDDPAWLASPFNWIRQEPSRRRGSIFEGIVEAYFLEKGFQVGRSPDSDADRIIAGLRVEIKGSTLWANSSYKFQQLRDQNYSVAICLGISPYDAHCWVIPKDVIMSGTGTLPGLTHQHGGQQGTDTAWLAVRPGSIPTWLQEYGGTLEQAIDVFRSQVQ